MKKTNEKRLHFVSSIWLKPLIMIKLCILFLICSMTSVSANTVFTNGLGTFQQNTVKGTVKDAATGEALPGVTIVVKGTTIGQLSDIDGKFSIPVTAGQSTLIFSFIGYANQEIIATAGAVLNVSLSVIATELSEVVIVGYGIQKKESVIGAISQVTAGTIKKGVQGGDLAVALTGALPGLAIVRSSGLPGGDGTDDDYATMYIRGQKTWNNAAPLILVDGIERPLNNINPNEIEKIAVLKDASSTAVFGVKGANGVIIVTTLHGKEGKPKLSFDVSTTGKTLARFMHREGSYMANLMKNYAILNELPISEGVWNYVVPNSWLQLYKDQTYPEYLPDIDWTDAFTRDWAFDKNISLTLSGGTKVVKYFGSLSYLTEGDILALGDVGQGYDPSFSSDRYNFRSNLDFDITPTTRFTANLSGYYKKQQGPSGGLATAWLSLYSRPPDLYPPRYSDGTWADYQTYSRFQNGLYLFDMFGYNVNKQSNLNTDFILNQKLDFVTKGLSANGKVSFDNTFGSSGPQITGYGDVTKWIQPQIVNEMYPGISADQIKVLEAKYTIWQFPSTASASSGFDFVLPPNAYGTESGSTGSVYRNLYYEFSLNYLRDFGKHSVSALGLVSRQVQATGSTFLSYREDWVGRATYGYDRRYNIEINAAYNGSEKFANKYRFGFFPSYAIGWTVSNEPFFKNLRSVVNNLKFRYSDGKIGSDAGIDRWQYVSSWAVSTSTYSFGAPYLSTGFPLGFEGVVPNPDIHWETAQKKDFGIETGFFRNMLIMNLDYYWEKRTGIFMSGSDIVVPDYSGTVPVSQNLGRVDAHGWEFEFQFSKTLQSGLNLWFNHSWTYAVDKVIARGDPALKPDYQKNAGYQIGQPRVNLNQTSQALQTWNEIYNVVRGTTNVNALPGDYALVDYNSDGIINSNDQIPYGYPSRPQFTYAPSLGANYKNLGLSLRFYGVYNIQGGIASYMGNFAELYSVVYPYVRQTAWSPEFNKTTTATRQATRFQSTATSGFFDNPRSYLRLQHVELSYILENQWIKKMGVSGLKFILSGDNLFLWSKMYEDLDAAQLNYSGMTRPYPTTKRVTVGLSLNL